MLIDEDPDYLAVAADGTFRSLRRGFDQQSGEWLTETEVIETAAELVEIYNPSDILQAFAEAEAATGEEEGTDDVARSRAGPPADADPYAAAADQWAAGQPEFPRPRREPPPRRCTSSRSTSRTAASAPRPG